MGPFKVESHIKLEEVEWWGLCHGTRACNTEADKVTGKAALRAQMGAGITEEGQEMER